MWLQGSVEQGASRFGPLTCRTGFDILTHVTAHARPVVVPRHEFQGLVMPGMSGDSSIVMQPNDITSQGTILRDIDVPLERNDLVTIRPVVRVSEKTVDGSVVLVVMHLSDPINDWSRQCLHRDWLEEMFV